MRSSFLDYKQSANRSRSLRFASRLIFAESENGWQTIKHHNANGKEEEASTAGVGEIGPCKASPPANEAIVQSANEEAVLLDTTDVHVHVLRHDTIGHCS